MSLQVPVLREMKWSLQEVGLDQITTDGIRTIMKITTEKTTPVMMLAIPHFLACRDAF